MSELKPIKGKLLLELADVWENEGIEAQSPERRAAFCEAADTLRTLASAPRIDTTLAPDRAPTHRCTHCGAFWMQWTDGWSLCSKDCGPCCDNSPDFLNVITPLIVSDIYARPQPSAEAVADNLHDSLMIELAYCRHAEKTVSETAIRIEAVIASALEAARREALEQAAKVADEFYDDSSADCYLEASSDIATAIRAIEENPNAG